jgi:hypothetical protein
MRENSQEYSEMLVSELSLGLSFTVRLGANHEPPLLSVSAKIGPDEAGNFPTDARISAHPCSH